MSAVLAISGLRFGWDAAAPVLDIDAFALEPAERVFLRGPSGSGKSTLLGLIGGVLRPQQGSIRVLGKELTAMGSAARDRLRADHIGYVFQQFNLLPYLGAIDNVLLATRFSRRRAQAQADASLREQAIALLGRLDLAPASYANRSASQLSVGQQQRVAAARALIGSPELVIADEPTSALDSDTRSGFLRLLFDECQRAGAALLFVSHDRSLEPLFDRSVDLTAINRAGVAPC